MDEIFIIETLSSDYETPNQVVGFAITEEEAISKVAEKNDLFNKCKILERTIYERVLEHEKAHKDLNPFEEKKAFVKWAAGIGENEITPEMRAERNAVKEENKIIQERNMAKMAITQANSLKIKEDLFEELATEEDVKEFYETKYRRINSLFFTDKNPFTYYKLERFK